MKKMPEQDVEGYFARLRELPFVKDVRIVRLPNDADEPALDAVVVIEAPNREFEFLVELKRTNLTYAIAENFLVRGRNWARRAQPIKRDQQLQQRILFAPHVPRKIGKYLAEGGANYVDLEGNCHLRLADRYIAAIEGRIPVRKAAEERGLRAAGYQVLFTILAKPVALNEGIVRIAELAGVGKTTVASTLEKLEHDGFLTTIANRRRLVNPGKILDRWLVGYANAVRPRLLLGRYRTQDKSPEDLERRIEQVLADRWKWAWGGGAAAMRLTQHYRGEGTVLHVAQLTPDLPQRLRALRAVDGPLVILGVPGPVAFEGIQPRTVHPLLVYTELLTSGEDRAGETAARLRERYLGGLD